jgi:hypothetical protein
VTGRALVFSDPRVIALLNERFVTVAVDNTRLQNQDDEEGRFLRLIAWQGRYKYTFEQAWEKRLDTRHGMNHQGLYATTTEGELLGRRGTQNADATLAMLNQALVNWEARKTQREASELGELTERDRQFVWEYPDDGLVLHLGVRDLPRKVDVRPENWRREAHNQDHVWLRREEMLSLVPPNPAVGDVFPMPERLMRRLVRFHLVDYVHGETPAWSLEQVRAAEVKLRVTAVTPERVELTLTGSARMAEESRRQEGGVPSRGFDASVLGYLVFDRQAERFRRFDVVAVGTRWGATSHSGRRNDDDPAPIGIAMTIAGKEARDRTPPHVSQSRNGLERYFAP